MPTVNTKKGKDFKRNLTDRILNTIRYGSINFQLDWKSPQECRIKS